MFTESVIRRSSVWSVEHRAINLAQGFPDDETPQDLKLAAIDAIAKNRNQYSDTWGTPALRQAVADKMNRFYGLQVNGDEHVTITCGATEAMMAALLAVVDPGDEVIILEPAYENFRPHCLIARAKPVYVPLAKSSFDLDREALAEAFTERTAAVIINNPNNPSGKVFSEADLSFIADLCQMHDVVGISDEVYEHMVFDGRKHICLASVHGLHDRWIVVSSCSKTYFMTGWRIGYAVSNSSFTTAIRRCHDFLSGAAPTPLQDAAAVALGFDNGYYSWLAEHYAKKRALLVDNLRRVGLACELPEGAYYVLADMSAFPFADSVEFCRYLLTEIGVVGVPWPSFYAHREIGQYRVRFTFSKTVETILSAVDRMKRLEAMTCSDPRKV
jgi:aminotransferase